MPFDRNRRFRLCRSLIDRPLELHLSVTTEVSAIMFAIARNFDHAIGCTKGPGDDLHFKVSDSVKHHLSRRHLIVFNVLFDFIFDGGCTFEQQRAYTKAASTTAQRQSENTGPRRFGLILRRCPPLESFFQLFELSTKRH